MIRFPAILFAGICLCLLSPAVWAAKIGETNDKEAFFVVRVQDDRLTVKAKDIPIRAVLKEIAYQAGIKIVFCGGGEEVFSADFSGVPLDEGLKRLAGDFSYAFIYCPQKTRMEEPEIREVIMYPKSPERPMNSASPALVATQKRPSRERDDGFLLSLFKALKDRYPRAREEVVDGSRQTTNERVFEKLTDALLDDDEDLRARVVEALGDFGDQTDIVPLPTNGLEE